jgi:uncharacterized protein
MKRRPIMLKPLGAAILPAALFLAAVPGYPQTPVPAGPTSSPVVEGRSGTPAAENHDLKIKEIREIMRISNLEENQAKILDLIMDRFKTDMPKVPAEFWNRCNAEMKEKLPLMDEQVILIYDKHFTQSDIEGILQFYKTPVGQRFIAELPALTRELLPVGMEWGKMVAAQVIEELKRAGYPYKPQGV